MLAVNYSTIRNNLNEYCDKVTDEHEIVIKFLGENPGACPWDEAKKYFSKSLMSISSEYNRSNSIKGTFN